MHALLPRTGHFYGRCETLFGCDLDVTSEMSTVVFGVNTHSVPTVDQFLRVEWTASIPTVDIESGSARYSAWRALRAACCLPAASACTSYGTGTI